MKKLLFLFFALCMIQVNAQTLSSMSKSASTSSNSMIESLATDQVENLTKKLNLNETQQKQVSGLVVSQLRTEKFQKLLKNVGAEKLLASGDSSKANEYVQNALLTDPDFKKEMGAILDDKQMKAMEGYSPK